MFSGRTGKIERVRVGCQVDVKKGGNMRWARVATLVWTLRGMHNEHGSYVEEGRERSKKRSWLARLEGRRQERWIRRVLFLLYRYARCLDTKSEADHGYRVRLCRPVLSKGLILMTRTDRPDSREFCGDQSKQWYTSIFIPDTTIPTATIDYTTDGTYESCDSRLV